MDALSSILLMIKLIFFLPIKNTVLPGISCKRADKVFLVKIKNKMLLQTIRILYI